MSSLAGKGKVAVNVATNKTCTSGLCMALVGVECVRAGAKRCTADSNGNLGRGNIGKDNFGTKNRGRGNIGTFTPCNTAFLTRYLVYLSA